MPIVFSCFLILLSILPISSHALPRWDANSIQSDWSRNGDIRVEGLRENSLAVRTVGSDPILVIEHLSVPATPWQYLVLQIRADQAGLADYYWTGDTSGPNGGLEEGKKARFEIPQGDQAREIVVFPFWHTEGTIRTLRLDLYDGTRFEIESIEVREWGTGSSPDPTSAAWDFEESLAPWRVHPAASECFSGPLSLPVEEKGWVTVEMESKRGGNASLLWASLGGRGLQSADFEVVGDGRRHAYNLELSGEPGWQSPLVALGLRIPAELEHGGGRVHRLCVSDAPGGPAWLETVYFGFEAGVNRVGQSARVLAAIRNRGGSASQSAPARLNLTPEVRVLPSLEPGEQTEPAWEIPASQTATTRATLRIGEEDAESEVLAETELRFDPPVTAFPATSVPPPRRVETTRDVCMYYFPGWDSASKWDCIRRWAPNRKPLLGYYDESNPECVDWQIKWAVENGITCFLVDWYWNQGNQSLTHWFEAYRKCRYRDQLKVALMWANHNPKGSHSQEDWAAVTGEWVKNYFGLPTYYRIGGKPAVFVWDPSLIRVDLGGSTEVRKALDLSQEMARQADLPGITFVAMHDHAAESQAIRLLEEGYEGATNYHEWGTVTTASIGGGREQYREVLESASQAWAAQDQLCGELTYYPVVDTGWDARPWHGEKSLVIAGRTPELFEELLRHAQQFCSARGKPLVVLGPANEWGEGSYIEPCTEFGFRMYEAIRRVFAKGEPDSWPMNVGPRDVGLGPYDLVPAPLVTCWTFETGTEDWRGMMNIANLRAEEGCLKFQTSSSDPALLISTPGLIAGKFHRAVLRMRLASAPKGGNQAQLFWSLLGAPAGEATSLSIPLLADTESHEYAFELSRHPRWRGGIPTLRLDPCSESGVEVWIEEFRFE